MTLVFNLFIDCLVHFNLVKKNVILPQVMSRHMFQLFSNYVCLYVSENFVSFCTYHCRYFIAQSFVLKTIFENI